MKKRHIVFLAGAAVLLIGFAVVLLFSRKAHPPKKDTGEGQPKEEAVTGDGKKETSSTTKAEADTGGEEDKGHILIHNIGRLYYLDPDGEEAFEETLFLFLKENGIETSEAEVLEPHTDDRAEEDRPALFYLSLKDKRKSIVQVSFEKKTGHYDFDLAKDGGDQMDVITDPDDGGNTEFEIPESSDDVTVPEPVLLITDDEGALEGTADLEELTEATTEFLRSIGEGRRELYVSSVAPAEDGYEAVLSFVTVRQDGRSIEIKYDGAYHFRLV